MNLLITGAWQQAKEYINEIEKMGHRVQFLQQEKEQLPCSYEWVEGVICNGLFLYHDISKFVNLKYIQLTSAGYDRVPLDYIKSKDIMVHNAKGVYSTPMAEYAIAMTLFIYKQIEFFRNNQRNSVWEKNRNLIELNKKNVCILGCGNVGIECARRFKAFDCKVTGISDYIFENEYIDHMYQAEKLKDILQQQDIIISALPLTESTYHMINKEVLDCIKKDAILISFSRGQTIDTSALIEKIKEQSIYAVLDVFEEEPLNSDSPLWQMEKVFITPHNSFVGDGNNNRLVKVIMNELASLE